MINEENLSENTKEEQINEQQPDISEDTGENRQQEAHAQQEKNQNSENIRILREEKERYQRESQEYYRRLQALEESKNKPAEHQYQPDDLVEYRVVQNEINSVRKEMELANAEWRLQSKYPDFSTVVNTENIELLKRLHPELAESIASNPNTYSKAVSTYNAIQSITKQDSTVQDRVRAQQNSTKPRASQSVSGATDSPLAKASMYAGEYMDEDKKNQIREEMRRILNG